MSNLKVGMRVVAVTDYPENNFKRISVGDFGTVTGFDEYVKDFVHVHFDNGRREEFYDWRVEPVTEEPKQMKATDKITVEITLAELAKIYALTSKANGTPSILYAMARDVLDPKNKRRQFMEGMTHSEVFYYNTYEQTFINLLFPKEPKKSKEQIKIEELQATIDKACKEIKRASGNGREEMITTAHKEWEELLETMTKEKSTQFAVVFDKDEQEWHYSRPAKFVAV